MKLVADFSNFITKLCSCKRQVCCAVRKSTFDAHKKEEILHVTTLQQHEQFSNHSCRKPILVRVEKLLLFQPVINHPI